MSLLQCPACGAEMSLDVLLSNEALRLAMVDLVKISLPLGALAMRYIGLFRPAKNRMSPDRMAKLMGQLVPDMQRGAITHKGRDWAMPQDGWRAGLEALLEMAAAGTLTLPLDNHRYLYTVLVGLADKVEATEERAVETTREQRVVTGRPAGLQSVADVVEKTTTMPPHIRDQIAALKRGESIKATQPETPDATA